MSQEIKRMDIKEFRAQGFLQEANRLFFHPIGLALEVIINEETGEESLGGVWDYRNDPEGVLFADDVISTKEAAYKASNIRELRNKKETVRIKKYNVDTQGIQQIGKKLITTDG